MRKQLLGRLLMRPRLFILTAAVAVFSCTWEASAGFGIALPSSEGAPAASKQNALLTLDSASPSTIIQNVATAISLSGIFPTDVALSVEEATAAYLVYIGT